MTREQIKQTKRRVVSIAVAAAVVAFGISYRSFDAEAFKTSLAVIGAYAAAYVIMRVVLYLEGET